MLASSRFSRIATWMGMGPLMRAVLNAWGGYVLNEEGGFVLGSSDDAE